MYHLPVLLHESVEGLNIKPAGIYVDVTFGGGGHSAEILKQLGNGRLFGFDQDNDALANVPDDPRFTFIPQNFKYVKNFMMLHGISQVDGILADLGVSSHQFDVAAKGFSTRFDGALDMRMDQSNPVTASQIVNSYDENDLTRILAAYGELQQPRRMARVIIDARDKASIETTFQLRDAVASLLPRFKENKVLAQLFQALRIEVNQEMKVLEEFLSQCAGVLRPGGRLVVISYHSLEDRMVKNFMRSGLISGEVQKDFFGNDLSPYKLISRKAIMADDDEMNRNSRSRSARLRIAERKEDGRKA
jgi:16S rRNA (cytosine1402-N4)-methyltransferase